VVPVEHSVKPQAEPNSRCEACQLLRLFGDVLTAKRHETMPFLAAPSCDDTGRCTVRKNDVDDLPSFRDVQ
jgi:hypothetical protein